MRETRKSLTLCSFRISSPDEYRDLPTYKRASPTVGLAYILTFTGRPVELWVYFNIIAKLFQQPCNPLSTGMWQFIPLMPAATRRELQRMK